MKKTVQYLNLGRMAYQESFDLQTAINQYLQINKSETGIMILVEHPPVFTLGRNRNTDDFLFPVDLVRNKGFEVIESNRGGNVTYHGPGQFVGYLLVNLEHFRKDVQWYVWSLEEWIIRVLAKFGLTADRKPAYRGVWVADEKICALGVAIKRWSTMHGFALNHQTNLEHYHWINPCGITEYGVTSMEKLGCSADAAEITEVLKTEFENVFNCRLEPTNLKEVMNLVNSTKA